MNRTLIDYTPETETLDTEAFRDETALESGSSGSVFSETEELEFAAEFLEVQSEHGLDRFLGDLISRAGKAVGTIVRSPIGQALGGVLKNAARQALPIAGRAIGGYVGGGTGAQARRQSRSRGRTALRPRARRAQPGGQGVRDRQELRPLRRRDGQGRRHRDRVRHRRWCSRNPQRLRPPPGTRPASFAVRRRRSRGAGSVAAATSSSSTASAAGASALKGVRQCMTSIARKWSSRRSPSYETEQWESGESWAGEGGLLSEADEMQLASELLGVSTEAELDQFLGKPDQEGVVGDWLGRALPDRPGGRRRAQERREEGAAARRRRAWRLLRRPARRKDRQRPGLRCWQRAGSRGREHGAGGPRVRGRQAVRPLRCQHRAESRGIADGGQPGRGGAGRRHQRGTPVPARARRPDRRGRAALPRRAADRPGDGCGAAARSSSTACDEALMSPFAAWMLTQEARALQTRLGRVRPFALLEPMVPAAALLPTAQSAIEEYLVVGRRSLRGQVQRLHRLAARSRPGSASNAQGQRRFSILRLAVQRGADPVRSVQRRDHPAQRARHGRVALRARRRVSRCAGAAREPGPRPAGDLLPRSRRRAPRSAGRARGCPAAARTRWRSFACRGSAWSAAASPPRSSTRSATRPTRCSSLSESLRPVLRGMQREPAATTRRCGSTSSAASRRSSPTSSRSRVSASPRAWG